MGCGLHGLIHEDERRVLEQLYAKVKVLVTQSCLTLFVIRMDGSPIGSSVHVIQARLLEWVAVPSSRGSSQPRDHTQVFSIASRFFTI